MNQHMNSQPTYPPPHVNLVLLNQLIIETSDKYDLPLKVTSQEDLFIGEVRITEDGRVILRDKSIDLFHLRGEDFYDFLEGVSKEERRILKSLSWIMRARKRKFQICVEGFQLKEIDWEEEYSNLSTAFDKYIESKREEGKTNRIIDCARERRLRELEEENEELRLDYYTREPKEDSGNLCAGIVIVLLIVIAVLFCSV